METMLQALGMAIATHPLQAALIAVVLSPAARVALREVRAFWRRRRLAWVAAAIGA